MQFVSAYRNISLRQRTSLLTFFWCYFVIGFFKIKFYKKPFECLWDSPLSARYNEAGNKTKLERAISKFAQKLNHEFEFLKQSPRPERNWRQGSAAYCILAWCGQTFFKSAFLEACGSCEGVRTHKHSTLCKFNAMFRRSLVKFNKVSVYSINTENVSFFYFTPRNQTLSWRQTDGKLFLTWGKLREESLCLACWK